MRKLKNKNYISLVALLCVVLITANIKSNANGFENIKKLTEDKNNSNIITEYSGETIDISNISIESAVDNSCNNYASTDEADNEIIDYSEVTGSITPVADEGYDNSSIYYVGETNTTEEVVDTVAQGSMLDDGNNVAVSTSLDSTTDYYVENWEEIEGDLSIKVNKQASCVTVYKGDTPIRAMVCSAGESTPEGTFFMQMQWDWLALIEGQYGRYCSQISGDYLFHSVPYNSMDIYDLDTEMYNQLGTLCSHGCIRLTIEDAKWIYDNCTTGTEITIYSDVVPGPMGKPDVCDIPTDQTWDPTDEMVE
ncbi:MAG: L,D-transpeptidase [Lachnospiraceae bacterium]|nr:L,D-transpeptidase [Lachnospiraceae bacterium]